jgi:hypothetical protein
VQQLLDFAKTTPSFSASSDAAISLREAFAQQAAKAPDCPDLMRQPPAAFAVCMKYMLIRDDAKREQLRAQYSAVAMVHTLVRKAKSGDVSVSTLRADMLGQLYDMRCGTAPIAGTAKMAGTVSKTLLTFLMAHDGGFGIYKPETVLDSLRNERPEIFQIAGTPLDHDADQHKLVLEELNAKYTRAAAHEKHRGVPPFATKYGPSVLECVCGYKFALGEQGAALTFDEHVEHIRRRRAAHFREVYNAQNEHGHPDTQSAHSSLHLCARRAYVRDDMTDAEIVTATVHQIIENGQGYIHDPNLENHVRKLLPSLRKFGTQRVGGAFARTSLADCVREELAVTGRTL